MTDTSQTRALLIKARELTQRTLDELDDAIRIVGRLHDAEIERRVLQS